MLTWSWIYAATRIWPSPSGLRSPAGLRSWCEGELGTLATGGCSLMPAGRSTGANTNGSRAAGQLLCWDLAGAAGYDVCG